MTLEALRIPPPDRYEDEILEVIREQADAM
jgi:hypothetical protein